MDLDQRLIRSGLRPYDVSEDNRRVTLSVADQGKHLQAPFREL